MSQLCGAFQTTLGMSHKAGIPKKGNPPEGRIPVLDGGFFYTVHNRVTFLALGYLAVEICG